MISLVKLSKTYARGEAVVTALHEVSLEVGRGEFCAFVGPSGCGKSTLLNLVAGLDRPTGGSFSLDGRDTATFSSNEWTEARRSVLGIVFQAFHLVPGLTALENVALPLLLRGESGRGVATRAQEVLEWVGMTHRRQHRPWELSGGEQQRVALARALAHQPKVLLADEPTGNLDSHQGQVIMELIRSLTKAGGVTVLLVTHSPVAAQMADYVWTMQDGRLVSRTPAQALTGVA